VFDADYWRKTYWHEGSACDDLGYDVQFVIEGGEDLYNSPSGSFVFGDSGYFADPSSFSTENFFGYSE